MLRQWVERLQSALSGEFDRAPRPCTLATVDPGGRAAARTVICRRVLGSGDVYLFSDARSRKHAALLGNASAEVVFWLPTRRQQFRIAGRIEIVGAGSDREALRRALWSELSDAARAMYLWPPPGELLAKDASAFPREVGAEVPVTASFEVLILRAETVESLDLNPHPHDRRRWRASNDWREERLNP